MSHKIYEQTSSRVQRSELAVPGSNSKMFEKALHSDVDFVFLDGGHSYETVKKDLKILNSKFV